MSEWVKITTQDSLPKKPGLQYYEYVDCLIFHKGEKKFRPWNCEHQCWDTDDYDDFYCDAMDPSHYMIVTDPPAEATP